MEYNVGDIVEYKYLPGVELTIIEIHTIPPTYISYVLSNGVTVFDSHITLLKAYQPEDRNNTPLIIAACIVGYLIMKG
ncbi:MAG: hypothetical protein KAJ19_10660 [Gammaproteobacteria bacterium]|nr:hypothetical protein [Gammaproteobacteria bacterium]